MHVRKSLLLVLLLMIVGGCASTIDGNMSQDVDSFSYTNQDGESVSREDLKGEWWVADFIFTNCTTVCPPMTNNMAHLQKKMAEKDLDAQLVSFTVDPKQDTPEQLKTFADQFNVSYDNWSFLTGYEFEEIQTLARGSFKTIVEEIPDNDQMMHGTRFYLVNPEGKVIKSYIGNDFENMDLIIEDLEKVL